MSSEAEPTNMYGRRDQKPCPSCGSDDFLAFSQSTMCGKCHLSASPEAWARRTVTRQQVAQLSMALHREDELKGFVEWPYIAVWEQYVEISTRLLCAAGFEVRP